MAAPAASPDVVGEAIVGVFTRFGRDVLADPDGLQRLVDKLTAVEHMIRTIDDRTQLKG